ncbi:MAG: hypothetical protein ACI94Y_000200 [Maribacter sp.]
MLYFLTPHVIEFASLSTDFPILGKQMSAGKRIISLNNHRGTQYKSYLKVYNELKATYNEICDEQAQKHFQKDYSSLAREEQKEIIRMVPLIISETEPVDD